MTKHFLKTLTLFVGMLIIGLIGIYLISHFDDEEKSTNALNSKTQVAK